MQKRKQSFLSPRISHSKHYNSGIKLPHLDIKGSQSPSGVNTGTQASFAQYGLISIGVQGSDMSIIVDDNHD